MLTTHRRTLQRRTARSAGCSAPHDERMRCTASGTLHFPGVRVSPQRSGARPPIRGLCSATDARARAYTKWHALLPKMPMQADPTQS